MSNSKSKSKWGLRISYSVMGYLCVLLAFVSLGTLVAALAFGSGQIAIGAAAGLVGSMVVAVLCLRKGAKGLSDARKQKGSLEHASIWDRPIAQDQVDKYRLTYRAAAETSASVGEQAVSAPIPHPASRADRGKVLVAATSDRMIA
jgi:hypothetical protein